MESNMTVEKSIEKGKTEIIDKDKVTDIQLKLLRKVLPVLEKHMVDTTDKMAVRSFVVECYAKTIRKLPARQFNQQLHKLVNLIVVRGLRSRDLAHREKARKSLVKLVAEVSPNFLSMIFEEMKVTLQRGYQQHVYIYSIHNLLQGLHENGELNSGCITERIIEQNIEVLLSELFGDLKEEKTNDQGSHVKQIKESKSMKAVPIFEILAQYVDFKKSFLAILAPIIKVLDESPSFNKIQQCEDLLSRVSTSLLKNPTVTGPQLLIFLYSIVDRGVSMSVKIKINDEKEKRDYGAGVQTDLSKRTKEALREVNMKIEMYWKKGN